MDGIDGFIRRFAVVAKALWRRRRAFSLKGCLGRLYNRQKFLSVLVVLTLTVPVPATAQDPTPPVCGDWSFTKFMPEGGTIEFSITSEGVTVTTYGTFHFGMSGVIITPKGGTGTEHSIPTQSQSFFVAAPPNGVEYKAAWNIALWSSHDGWYNWGWWGEYSWKPCPECTTPGMIDSNGDGHCDCFDPDDDGICGCTLPLVVSGDSCDCPPGKTIVMVDNEITCACDGDLIDLGNGDCGCPEGMVKDGTDCLCGPGRVFDPNVDACVCAEGFTDDGEGGCCPDPQGTGECDCEEGYARGGPEEPCLLDPDGDGVPGCPEGQTIGPDDKCCEDADGDGYCDKEPSECCCPYPEPMDFTYTAPVVLNHDPGYAPTVGAPDTNLLANTLGNMWTTRSLSQNKPDPLQVELGLFGVAPVLGTTEIPLVPAAGSAMDSARITVRAFGVLCLYYMSVNSFFRSFQSV